MLSRNACSQRGATMVEFAIISLAFFTIVVGIFDFGRAILYYNMLSNAAREGARYGVIWERNGQHITADMICEVAASKTAYPDVPYASISGCGQFGDLEIKAVEGTRSTFDANDKRILGSPVIVEAWYDFDPVTPLVGALVGDPVTGKLRLYASSSMYVED